MISFKYIRLLILISSILQILGCLLPHIHSYHRKHHHEAFASPIINTVINGNSRCLVEDREVIRCKYGRTQLVSRTHLLQDERDSHLTMKVNYLSLLDDSRGSHKQTSLSGSSKISRHMYRKQLRASSVCGILRNTDISRSSSRLYSSAVEDIDTGHREGEVVNSHFDNRPINLFHSVLCGSDDSNVAIEHSSTSSVGTKLIKGKAPIIVLPGLLGSARNFQSWIKLVQQCEIEQNNMDATNEEKEWTHFETRDIICMDLRNHGRTGVHYGSLKMDFDLMARDVIHTLESLGLSKVHLVGHSLGGKVAAVAALKLANQVGMDGTGGEQNRSDIRILSMTMIDVSPVDYDSEEAFEDVFRTVDIVNELDTQLSLVGTTPSKPSDDSSSINVRSALNALLGGKVTDPMLKAFLLASIQPKEIRLDPSVGGLSARIKSLMRKIELHRRGLSPQQQQSYKEAVEGIGADIASPGTSNSIPSGSGFEWKFSVRGIVAFRGELGAWPYEFSRRRAGADDKEESMSGTLDPSPFLNPVLLMKGGNSKFVRSSHIPSISLLFPNFTLMTVREAGHWLHFEKPKESSELLMKFIRTVEDRM